MIRHQKIQLFYFNDDDLDSENRFERQPGEPKQVAGFGWMNQNNFVHGSYDVKMIKTLEDEEEAKKQMSLKWTQLSFVKYQSRQGNEEPIFNEMPISFAITMYHIVYLYPTNITVMSKIEDKIVYNKSFDRMRPILGIELDYRSHQLIAFTMKEKIYMTSLTGEDCEAWKFYEKQNKLELALKFCRSIKQKS